MLGSKLWDLVLGLGSGEVRSGLGVSWAGPEKVSLTELSRFLSQCGKGSAEGGFSPGPQRKPVLVAVKQQAGAGRAASLPEGPEETRKRLCLLTPALECWLLGNH